MAGVTAAIERRLMNAGFVEQETSLPMPRAAALGASILLLGIALERFAHATSVHHPVGILIMLMLINLVLAGHYSLSMNRRTPLGEAALGRVKRDHELRCSRLALNKSVAPAAVAAALLPLSFALLGSKSVMNDKRFAGIDYALGGWDAR